MIADKNGGKPKNRVMFYCDEFDTLPKIDGMEAMFSAERRRKISIIAVIQSFAQLEQNYGKQGIVSTTLILNSDVYLLFAFSFGIKITLSLDLHFGISLLYHIV